MIINCLYYSNMGEAIAKELESKLINNYSLKIFSGRGNSKRVAKKAFENGEALIFIGATGIAVRVIADYIKDKKSDPPILVIDDLKRYVLPLLSGHIGGANKLAEEIAATMGAKAIITTASEGRGFKALDMLAKENGLVIEEKSPLTQIMTRMANNEEIEYFSEIELVIDYKNLSRVIQYNEKSDRPCIIISSDSRIKPRMCPERVVLRPKNIHIGMGCRKGVDYNNLKELLQETLIEHNLSILAIKTLATIDIKKDEKGLIMLADELGLELTTFSIDELKSVEDKCLKSNFVKDNVGVSSVSEACVRLLGKNIIVRKKAINNMTISISKGDKSE